MEKLKDNIISNLNELEKEIVNNLERTDRWILEYYLNNSRFLSDVNIKYNDIKTYVIHYKNELNFVSNLGTWIGEIKKYMKNVDNKYLFHDYTMEKFIKNCLVDFECIENFYGHNQTNDIKKEFNEMLKENFYNNKIKTLSKDESHEIKLDIMELNVCFESHNEILDRIFNTYHKLINDNFNINIHEWKAILKEHPFSDFDANAHFFVEKKWNEINKKESSVDKNQKNELIK